MATDLVAINVVAGDDILASEYNTLRSDLVRRAGDYEVSTGSGGSYAISVDSSITANAEGQVFRFRANHANPGVATLNVNGNGALTMQSRYSLGLGANAIQAGDIVTVVNNGSNYDVISPIKDIIAVIQGTRAINTATGTQNIAHGLGSTPKYITVHAVCHFNEAVGSSGDSQQAHSNGYSDGSTNACTFVGSSGVGTNPFPPLLNSGNNASACIDIKIVEKGSGSVSHQQTATATFTGTNVVLSWTLATTGSPANTNNISFTILVHS
jgi:hypothetical protein